MKQHSTSGLSPQTYGIALTIGALMGWLAGMLYMALFTGIY